MSSKYDTYWENKLNSIIPLLKEAHRNGKSSKIDVSNILNYGNRSSWYGVVEVFKNELRKGEMAHAKSLGRVIRCNCKELLESFENVGFRMKVSNLKLMVERMDVGNKTNFDSNQQQMEEENKFGYFNKLLQELDKSTQFTKSSLNQVPKLQGVYTLWLNNYPLVCLKVGMAGPRRGKGLQERLRLHFLSNPGNTVLAEHMEADIEYGRKLGYDFQDISQRQSFLENKCFFKVLPLPDRNKSELRQFEKFLESKLNPIYKGRVKKS